MNKFHIIKTKIFMIKIKNNYFVVIMIKLLKIKNLVIIRI